MPAGQFKNAAPLGARSAGQSAPARIPALLILLPIVTRMGRDYRPGLRQQIERVALRAAPAIIRQGQMRHTPVHRGVLPHVVYNPTSRNRRYLPPTLQGSCPADRENDRSCRCRLPTFQ